MNNIEKLEKKIATKVEKYNADYEDGCSMANDLLDQAEGIMMHQRQMIVLLKEKGMTTKMELETDKYGEEILKCLTCKGEFIVKDGSFNYCPRCGRAIL